MASKGTVGKVGGRKAKGKARASSSSAAKTSTETTAAFSVMEEVEEVNSGGEMDGGETKGNEEGEGGEEEVEVISVATPEPKPRRGRSGRSRGARGQKQGGNGGPRIVLSVIGGTSNNSPAVQVSLAIMKHTV